jgi:large subunit ribosomal protein L29
MLKISEINKLDAAAINNRVQELRKELFDLKLQKNTTSIEKSHLLTELRRDIARLLTVLNNKEASE